MRVMHTLTAHGVCPVNGDKDTYRVIVTILQADHAEPVAVESILDVVECLTAQPIYQEALTAQLATQLSAGWDGRKVIVTTSGYHGPASSRVETDCTVEA